MILFVLWHFSKTNQIIVVMFVMANTHFVTKINEI